MIIIHYCIINILGIIKPFCPKGHVMEIKDESKYSRCDGCCNKKLRCFFNDMSKCNVCLLHIAWFKDCQLLFHLIMNNSFYQ